MTRLRSFDPVDRHTYMGFNCHPAYFKALFTNFFLFVCVILQPMIWLKGTDLILTRAAILIRAH